MLSKILNDSLEETLSKRQLTKHITQDNIMAFRIPFLIYRQANKGGGGGRGGNP